MNTRLRPRLARTVLTLITLIMIILISGSARAAGPWYVAPGGDDSDNCLTPGTPCETINGAIGKATSGDTIYVATGTYTNSAATEVVLIDKDITLSGGWDTTFTTQSGISTVDGSGVRRGITVFTPSITNIDHFIIQNGVDDEYGGGIFNNYGTLTLNDCQVSGNTGEYYGGGIYNYYGNLILINSTVSNNNSFGQGGGIENYYGILTLDNSTISGNTSQSMGGGITNSGTITLTNSTVSGNTTNGAGGGIYNFDTLNLNNSIISGNTSQSSGGGIFNYGNTTSNDSTINTNTVLSGDPAIGGGGICNFGIVTLNDSAVTGNVSNSNGGGIRNEIDGSLTLNNSTINNNTGGLGGGGIYNAATLTITNSNFSNNNDVTGGGIYSVNGLVTISNTTFSGNNGMSGGGIYNIGGLLIISNTTFSSNTALFFGGQAGGILNTGTLTITNSTFSGNSADGFGGGLWNSIGATATVLNSTFSSNSAGDGGGIYNGGTVTIKNTIIANSPLGGNCSGTITNSGNNIDSGTTCGWGSALDSMSNIDPMLSSLQNNGGATKTHALLSGSPAIDAGNPALPGSGGNACEATDQRGVIRPYGAACDIGAFELEIPTVKFSNSNFSVTEDMGTAIITVSLSEAITQTVTVNYSTSDGTALVGNDYITATGMLTFTPGVITQTLTVSITNDLLDEADETVMLTLNNPTNIELGIPNPATLTLVDDDLPPTVQFSQSAFIVDENAGTATITVTLSAVSAFPVTVDFATSDGSATAGNDYTPITGTLTIAPGTTTQTFTVTITDDALDEADETLTLTLSNPGYAVPGTPITSSLMIEDNDFKVFLPLTSK